MSIVIGFLAILFGAFWIHSLSRRDFRANPFCKFLGISNLRRRSFVLLVAAGFCLSGMVMIMQGLRINF